VVDPTAPKSVETTTVPPEDVKEFEYASFSCTVICEVVEPSASIEVGDAVTVDSDVDAGPGFTVKPAEVPVPEPTDGFDAVKVLLEPAVVTVTE